MKGETRRPIGIIGAMDEEIRTIKRSLQDVREVRRGLYGFLTGNIDGIPAVLLQSGIGKVNAAIGTTLLIEQFQPLLIINTGSAGGIEPSLHVGDIIIAQEILHHDVDTTAFGYAKGQIPKMPAAFEPERLLLDLAVKLSESMTRVRFFVGSIASGDIFMDDPERVMALRKDHPGLLAVEMESAAIAQTCYQMQVPYIVFRSVSDLANSKSPGDFTKNLKIASENSAAAVLTLIELLTAPQAATPA